MGRSGGFHELRLSLSAATALEGLTTTRLRPYLAQDCCAESVNTECSESMSDLDR